jgi:Tfp pilus assembly protein PilX
MIRNKIKSTLCINKQKGVVLIVSLVMLILVSILGISSIRTATLNEKTTANSFDRLKALQSAEAGVRFGISQLDSPTFSMDNFVNNVNNQTFYDMRRHGAINQADGNKTVTNWLANRSPANWPWEDDSKRSETTNYIDTNNSMGLVRKPQFSIGMQEAILRAGSEGFICLPYTVIGAGQGSSVTTQVLIEVKVIPRSGCSRSSPVK